MPRLTKIPFPAACCRDCAVDRERFRLLSRSTNDALWDWDLKTGKLWWGEGYRNLFGGAGRARGVQAVSVHPDDLPAVRERMARIVGTGNAWEIEYRCVRPDGRCIVVLDRGHVIRNRRGRAVRLVGGLSDITERRATESQLTWLAALLDESRDSIIVRMADGKVAFWNRGATELFGWSAAEAAGRDYSELVSESPEESAMIRTELEKTGAWCGERKRVTRDGAPIVTDCRYSMVTRADGVRVSLLSETNVTERRQLEQHLIRARTGAAETGKIVHDIHNALGPVLSGVALLGSYKAPKRIRAVIDHIERNAARGQQLLSQIAAQAKRGAP